MAQDFKWGQVSGAMRMGYIARRMSWPGDTTYIAGAYIMSEGNMILLIYPGVKDGEDSVAVEEIHGWHPSDEDKVAEDWEIRGTPASMVLKSGAKDEAG